MSRAMYNSIDPGLQLRHKQNSIAGIATQVHRYRIPKGAVHKWLFFNFRHVQLGKDE